jgi:hypothetical protein
MKGYPVGSLVVLQNAANFPELEGVECTITRPLTLCTTAEGIEEVYGTDLTHKGYLISPLHRQVRLKNLPPDEAFDKFLNKLKQPVEETV